MIKKSANRYVVLCALFVNSFCIGGVYAWSVFAMPLASYRNWEYGSVTLAYSLMNLMIAAIGIPGGRLLDKFGPKKLMLLSSALFGFGWMLSGFAATLPMFYFLFGICCGGGSGLRYNPCITTAVRWFPDKKGFASGLVVGAMGLAALPLAPIANALLERFDIQWAFGYLGIAFFVLSFIASLFVAAPPEGWLPEGYKASLSGPADNSRDYTWQEIFKEKRFYLLWVLFFGSCVSGLMLIGHASAIGQSVVNMTSSQAALLVGVMAIANFGGRMIMGSLSDYMGRYKILIICLTVSTLDMLLLANSNSFAAFMVAIILVGITFGGVLSVFPTVVSDVFGMKHMGINYGILFTAYGVAAIVGPMAAAVLSSTTGSYVSAFVLAGVFSLISLLLTILVMRSKSNSTNEQAYANT